MVGRSVGRSVGRPTNLDPFGCGLPSHIFTTTATTASVDTTHRMLRHKTLKNTVLLILANKTDYAGCMALAEIVEGLDVRKVI